MSEAMNEYIVSGVVSVKPPSTLRLHYLTDAKDIVVKGGTMYLRCYCDGHRYHASPLKDMTCPDCGTKLLIVEES